jgi:hypothetical protein
LVQNLLDGSIDDLDAVDPFYRASRENGIKWMRFGKRTPQAGKWMRFGKVSSGMNPRNTQEMFLFYFSVHPAPENGCVLGRERRRLSLKRDCDFEMERKPPTTGKWDGIGQRKTKKRSKKSEERQLAYLIDF